MVLLFLILVTNGERNLYERSFFLEKHSRLVVSKVDDIQILQNYYFYTYQDNVFLY